MKFFLKSLSGLWILLVLIFSFIFPLPKALILAGVISFLFSLFFSFHLENKGEKDSFEITPANKRQDRGLKDYEKEIDSVLTTLRYNKTREGHKTIYSPRTLYRVMNGKIEVESTPYLIKVTGSRSMVRILKRMAELKPDKDAP